MSDVRLIAMILMLAAGLSAPAQTPQERLAALQRELDMMAGEGSPWYYIENEDQARDVLIQVNDLLQDLPNELTLHYFRAQCHAWLEQDDAALTDYNRAMDLADAAKLAQTDLALYVTIGDERAWQRVYLADAAKALAELQALYTLASQHEDQVDSTYNVAQSLAYIYAMHPDPEVRDGKRAQDWVRTMALAYGVEHLAEPDVLQLQAAAYADLGEFELALVAQKGAIQAYQTYVRDTPAETDEDRDWYAEWDAELKRQLQAYEAKQPYADRDMVKNPAKPAAD